MALDPQKTQINGQTYENIPAEVVRVDFNGSDKEKLYTIYCKLIGAFGSQANNNIVQARALDANIKNIPIKGEVVMLLKAPTAYNSALRTGQEYYYTNPISIQSSIHHNGLPGITDIGKSSLTSSPSQRQNAEDGVSAQVTSRLQVNKTIDPGFPERNDVYPIQPYPGDIIIEGRWGQSIRFGSTVDERRSYPQLPLWKKGLGDTGNPILVISNGTNPDKKPFNEFILEDPDKDDSAIWMTSGQTLNFTPASAYTPSSQNRSVDLHNKNEYAGNQILLASDRIILNARRQEIMAFSAEGIGLSSEKGVAIDGGKVIELESSRINLGVNAVSPVLLGDRTLQWLGDLCDALANLCTNISNQTHPTGTGPSGPPINAAAFNLVKSNIKSLRSSLKNLPSDLVFVCEASGGPSAGETQKAEERAEKKEGYVEPSKENANVGDRADSLAAEPEDPKVPNVVTMIDDVNKIEKEKKEILEKLAETSGASLTENPAIPNSGEDISGTSGTSGTFGTSGTSGTSGTLGTSGTSGTEGTSGVSEDVIPGTVSESNPNGITYENLGVEKSKMNLVGGRWNYQGDIKLDKNDLLKITTNGVVKYEIPIPFGKVTGKFDCSNIGLSNLNNAPQEVNYFDCSGNSDIKSLAGGPKTAKVFVCARCSLKDLLGGPEYVEESFNVSRNDLETLRGAPKKFGTLSEVQIQGNIRLISLAGLPTDYTGWEFRRLNARECDLTDRTIFEGVNELRFSKTLGSISLGSQVNGRKLDMKMVEEFTGAPLVYIS